MTAPTELRIFAAVFAVFRQQVLEFRARDRVLHAIFVTQDDAFLPRRVAAEVQDVDLGGRDGHFQVQPLCCGQQHQLDVRPPQAAHDLAHLVAEIETGGPFRVRADKQYAHTRIPTPRSGPGIDGRATSAHRAGSVPLARSLTYFRNPG